MRNEIKAGLCACGIALSALMVLLSGPIYQSLYLGNPEFTDGLEYFRTDMREQGWSVEIASLTVAIAWAMALAYYYVINSVRFDRWWHWLFMLAISTGITAAGCRGLLNWRMDSLEPGLSQVNSQLTLALSGWNLVIGAVMFVLVSYSCRWWSSNCRHTPIPQ